MKFNLSSFSIEFSYVRRLWVQNLIVEIKNIQNIISNNCSSTSGSIVTSKLLEHFSINLSISLDKRRYLFD